LTLSFGPVYAFTARMPDGSSVPAFRVDHLELATDGQAIRFGPSGMGLTDDQGHQAGQGSGIGWDKFSAVHSPCIRPEDVPITPMEGGGLTEEGLLAVSDHPVTLARGVCWGFPDDKPPVTATTLLYFDCYAIPLTPVGQ